MKYWPNSTAVHTPGIDVNVTTSIPVPIAIQFKLYNILMPLLAIIIILINFIIVLSSGLILHRGQQHPRSTYIFLGNVALSDFFIGVAFIFGHFYPAVKRNEIVCCISVGMTVSSALVSVYSIGLIAIDRYLYILYGLRYQRYLSTNRARMMVAATWVLGAIVGYLPAMGIREFTDNGKWCWFIILVPRSLVLVTTSIGLIPLITIIVLYSIILKTALDKISNLKKAARESMGTSVGSLRLFRGGQDRNSVASNMNELNNNGGYINDDIDRLPRKRRGFWNCCRRYAMYPIYAFFRVGGTIIFFYIIILRSLLFMGRWLFW
ncbi:GPR119 family protein [Megaselia abdita]